MVWLWLFLFGLVVDLVLCLVVGRVGGGEIKIHIGKGWRPKDTVSEEQPRINDAALFGARHGWRSRRVRTHAA